MPRSDCTETNIILHRGSRAPWLEEPGCRWPSPVAEKGIPQVLDMRATFAGPRGYGRSTRHERGLYSLPFSFDRIVLYVMK